MARPRRRLRAPLRQYKPSLRQVLRLCRLGLSPHTGRECGLSVQPRVAACMVCSVMPGAASRSSGLGMWGVHPQRMQQVLSGGDYCLSAR